MPAKKSTSKNSLIKQYMQHVLEEGNKPKNVYAFMKHLNASESDFYKHFASFEALEASIFESFFNETLRLLEKNDEYKSFESKDKLLSFYFTFFAILSKNRSYVIQTLNSNKLQSIRTLSKLKKPYQAFVDSLNLPIPNLGIEKLESMKDKGLAHVSFQQLLFTLHFWMKDDSPNFEKTDMLIEKSINTGFEVLEHSPVSSLLDLGKFLFKENLNMN